ncbi:MAG: hypothetical protein JWQ21_1827 [Herminiimonas sp.]|nr:hypothetical protein [Herminiimonas sp.]
MKIFPAFAFAALMMAGTVVMAASAPVNVTNGILTSPAGMTLYIFDRDMPGDGKSTCNGPCATNWPALTATDTDQATGDYSIVTRDDGKKQWAYKGKPLYTWVKDQKPGDKTGDGFNNIWHVAKP